MTPEGKVKKKINELLDKYRPSIYYYMPVPNGYGKPTIDYLGCFHGLAFGIEAKRPGKAPTARQDGTLKDITAAGGKVFVIDGDTAELEAWLERVDARLHVMRNQGTI